MYSSALKYDVPDERKNGLSSSAPRDEEAVHILLSGTSTYKANERNGGLSVPDARGWEEV
jgi:hypothetical protein